MTRTILILPVASALVFGLVSSTASADVPMPECVDNPACEQGGGCSVGGPVEGAPAAAGLLLMSAAVLVMARRRLRRAR